MTLREKLKIVILSLILMSHAFIGITYAEDDIFAIISNTEETQDVVEEESDKPLHTPISVERQNINGVEYLVKTYDVPANTPQAEVEESEFTLENFIFRHITTTKDVGVETETKSVTEEASAENATDSTDEWLKKFPQTKEYQVDGFVGTLYLDASTISSAVKGYTSKSNTISATQEYNGLMYQDPAFIPQTTTKNGSTLPLTNISWVVTGTGLSGDTLVPTEYKAVASYGKSYTTQVPTGYTATARYTGTVEKSVTQNVVYQVAFQGEVIPEPPEPPKSASEVVVEVGSFILGGLLVIGLIVGGVFIGLLLMKNRNNVQVYNMIDKEFVCLGKQVMDIKKPVIDLNQFEDMIQSNEFAFVLNSFTTKKQHGKNITVTLKDISVKHRINKYNEEYRFELKLDLLDAE